VRHAPRFVTAKTRLRRRTPTRTAQVTITLRAVQLGVPTVHQQSAGGGEEQREFGVLEQSARQSAIACNHEETQRKSHMARRDRRRPRAPDLMAACSRTRLQGHTVIGGQAFLLAGGQRMLRS
jgi:hypothetical protein